MAINPSKYNVTKSSFLYGERVYNHMAEMYSHIPLTDRDIHSNYYFYLPFEAINRYYQYLCVIEKKEYPGDYLNSNNEANYLNEIRIVPGYENKIILSHVENPARDNYWFLAQCENPVDTKKEITISIGDGLNVFHESINILN